MLLRWVAIIVQAVKYIEPQIRLAAKAGKSKKQYKLSMLSDKTLEKVSIMAEAPIEAVFTDPTYGKVFYSSSLVFFLFMFCESQMLCLLIILLLCYIFCSSLNVEKH